MLVNEHSHQSVELTALEFVGFVLMLNSLSWGRLFKIDEDFDYAKRYYFHFVYFFIWLFTPTNAFLVSFPSLCKHFICISFFVMSLLVEFFFNFCILKQMSYCYNLVYDMKICVFIFVSSP